MKSKFVSFSIPPNLVLKQLREEDAEDLALLADDLSVWENLRDSMPMPYTYHEALGFIETCLEEIKPLSLGIFYEGNFVGMVGIMPGKDVNRITCDVGYWIGAPFRGKGIATAALQEMMRYAMHEFGFYKLTACVFEGNMASKRVLEKCGFEQEATLKKHALKAGELKDEWRFSYYSMAFDLKKFEHLNR